MLKTERAQFLVDNLDLPSASGVKDAKWEHFQLMHLQDDSILRVEVKSRQIAASFTYSAEAIANAVLYGVSSLFQSINLDEAREKIIYARAIYENLNVKDLPKLSHPDTTTSIGFDNDARIISSPGTPQRGKSRFWVYLDEWAHQKHDRANYTAAFPIVSKGGKIRGASSPMGAAAHFGEIFTESTRAYSGYTRKSTPWWEIQSFCNDVPLAYVEAPSMATIYRVEKFGNDRIRLIYENMPEEDFAQEYELVFADEVTSWISWELIRRNQQPELVYYHIKSHDNIEQLIADVKADILTGKIESSLVGGLDIGRTRDLTEFCGLGKTTTGQLPLRIMISLANTRYEYQEHCIHRLIKELPFTQVLIDKNGIGNQIAESLGASTSGIAQGVTFTNLSKELWSVEVRVKFERGLVPIPLDRDLAYQIHSIKKKITPAKNNVFDTERNEKHHADKFWALALALWAGKPSSSILKTGVNPVAGYRG